MGKKGRTTKSTKPARRKSARRSWLDAKNQSPVIAQEARRLGSFMEAMADGVIDEDEVRAQEKRVVDLMRQIEPQLDDAVHEKMTRLLCELTAYDTMQFLHAMHRNRRPTKFRG